MEKKTVALYRARIARNNFICCHFEEPCALCVCALRRVVPRHSRTFTQDKKSHLIHVGGVCFFFYFSAHKNRTKCELVYFIPFHFCVAIFFPTCVCCGSLCPESLTQISNITIIVVCFVEVKFIMSP